MQTERQPMNLIVASFRIEEEQLKKLRRLAHRQSLAEGEGRDVTWADIVRGLIQKKLAAEQ